MSIWCSVVCLQARPKTVRHKEQVRARLAAPLLAAQQLRPPPARPYPASGSPLWHPRPSPPCSRNQWVASEACQVLERDFTVLHWFLVDACTSLYVKKKQIWVYSWKVSHCTFCLRMNSVSHCVCVCVGSELRSELVSALCVHCKGACHYVPRLFVLSNVNSSEEQGGPGWNCSLIQSAFKTFTFSCQSTVLCYYLTHQTAVITAESVHVDHHL